MLVLSRRVGESLRLTLSDGKVILIKLLRLKGAQQVSLGFEAPPGVSIVRSELPSQLNIR